MGLRDRLRKWFGGVEGKDLASLNRAVYHGNLNQARELLDRDSSLVDGRDDLGRTPLHYAAWRGQREMAELLIAKGADLNSKTDRGHTPLYLAVRKNQRTVVELLLASGADVNAGNQFGERPIHSAGAQIAELLRQHGAR